jgi:hypothetical protein
LLRRRLDSKKMVAWSDLSSGRTSRRTPEQEKKFLHWKSELQSYLLANLKTGTSVTTLEC